MIKNLQTIIFVSCLLIQTSCASIDFDYPRDTSTALSGSTNTYLGRRFTELVASAPEEQSGFVQVENGIDALAVRLALAQSAEVSIDAQYYLIKGDQTSKAFIDALLKAADRGVRVRLLLDDYLTRGHEFSMAGVDSHPNFEIRIFNPFLRGKAGNTRSILTEFGRINRRMHTKSFTVDNQVTIIGGRNIADEYFAAREDTNFDDLDVVGIGPVVGEVSAMFDSFWNHETSLPLPAFARMPDDPAAELEAVRGRLREASSSFNDSIYRAVVSQQIEMLADIDNDVFTWAPYALVYDPPDKVIKERSGEIETITSPLRESILSAENDLIIISPYFVPLKSGIEQITGLQSRGVEVTIITNSLATNNHISVHGGYAPSRKPLLEAGVRIYEARPDADVLGAEIAAADDARVALHTKAYLVDRREVFIGSFNFDPRSANLNTESGVIIRSPEISDWFSMRIIETLPTHTYELFLNEDGKLRWRAWEDDQEIILDREPKTGWWQRFKAGFLGLMPISGQL
jgi:cardiolipin synthase C